MRKTGIVKVLLVKKNKLFEKEQAFIFKNSRHFIRMIIY